MHNLLKLKEDFLQRGILISFSGAFTHSIIEEIGNAIKSYLTTEDLTLGTITDVFAVYIEQTQNVRNYFKRPDISAVQQGSGILVITNIDGCYTVCSGNAILRDDVPELVSRLETINSLDKDGLKKFYKEQLHKKLVPDAIGAGLGLIDMARRSSGKLVYRFEKQDEMYDFFSLFVKVNGA